MAYEFFTTAVKYTSFDLGTISVCSVLNVIGTTSLSIALQTGRGGPIYSINSLMSLIPLFLNILINQLFPTPLQYLGIVFGFVGAVITANLK
jgi:drug/metabolite transporter (DMT)-like permease